MSISKLMPVRAAYHANLSDRAYTEERILAEMSALPP